MKFTLILLAMIPGLYAVAQTFSPQTSGVSTPLNGISFSSPATGIVVGNGGVIRKTSNAGLNWTASPSGTTADLTAVAFVGASTYIAVGNSGTILKTTNGGASWNPVTSGTNYRLNGVFANGPVVYACGENGTILASTNSGNAWSSISTGISFNLNQITFVSNLVGYAVGDGGTILQSVNAGQAWNIVASGTTTHKLTSVFFSDEAHGVITGGIAASNQSKIFRTTNSGGVFNTTDFSGTSLNALGFADYFNGFAVGGSINSNSGTILQTTNQGASWTPVVTTSSRLLGVCYPTSGIAYACGMDGTILRYAENTAGLEEAISSEIQISPNPGNGVFIMESGSDPLLSAELFTANGEKLFTVYHPSTIDLSACSSGLYLVVLRSEHAVLTRKLVKE